MQSPGFLKIVYWEKNSNKDLCPSWPNLRVGAKNNNKDLCPFWPNLGMGNGIVTKALILLGILGDGEMDDDEDHCPFIHLGMRKDI